MNESRFATVFLGDRFLDSKGDEWTLVQIRPWKLGGGEMMILWDEEDQDGDFLLLERVAGRYGPLKRLPRNENIFRRDLAFWEKKRWGFWQPQFCDAHKHESPVPAFASVEFEWDSGDGRSRLHSCTLCSECTDSFRERVEAGIYPSGAVWASFRVQATFPPEEPRTVDRCNPKWFVD